MTTKQAKDYKEMYEVGKVTLGRFRFLMRIFTKPNVKLLTWNNNK